MPIPGTKRRAYLEENVRAQAMTLSPDDLVRLDHIAPKGIAAGARYPDAAMRTLNG